MATVIAILYSLWYPEVERTLAIPWADFKADRGRAIAAARSTLWSRALPLVIVSALPTVVFASNALDTLTSVAIPASRYDAVAAAFAVVYLLTLVLLAVAVEQFARLLRWHRRLNAMP